MRTRAPWRICQFLAASTRSVTPAMVILAGLAKARYVDEKRNPCQIYTSQLSKNTIFSLFTTIYSQRFFPKLFKRFPLSWMNIFRSRISRTVFCAILVCLTFDSCILRRLLCSLATLMMCRLQLSNVKKGRGKLIVFVGLCILSLCFLVYRSKESAGKVSDNL